MDSDPLTAERKARLSSFDPRLYQVTSVGLLLLYGLFRLDFDVTPLQIAVTLGTALLTQYAGTPLSIPLHRLESGSLLIFAFFMISDPKTTPDSRTGRLVFSCFVALGALSIQFGLYRPNGPLWALIVCSFLIPLLDRVFPGRRYDWSNPSPDRPHSTGFAPVPVRLSPSMSQPREFL